MSKLKLKALDKEVRIIRKDIGNFICLTDMSIKEPSEWFRNNQTKEYLSLWENDNNKNYNPGQLAEVIKIRRLSPTKWIEYTNAIGIFVSFDPETRGTWAHEDIALEYATWLSGTFKYALLKDYKRLKEEERLYLNGFLSITPTKKPKVFIDEFYDFLYRMHPKWGKFDRKKGTNIQCARWTNDLVYSRLEQSLLEELIKINPIINGKRETLHHYFLTEGEGRPALEKHIYALCKIAKGIDTWQEFMYFVNVSFPITTGQSKIAFKK